MISVVLAGLAHCFAFSYRLKSGETTQEMVGEKVGEKEKQILSHINKNNSITYIELANLMGISENSIYKNIEKLKQKGLLKRIGPAKGGYWKVITVE